jgi:predicted O-linked N-acetylglucosamine transferase (SPINDLY family)
VAEYFQRQSEIDIALDTFPYPGIRTTCDALWMGVPVVARTGHDPVSRAGMGPLILTGLKDWIAPDPQAYVRIAVERARDIDGLGRLRSTLRQTMRQSPLMDTADFSRRWEQAMVAMGEMGRVTP